jgi:hypothetical protein
MLRDSRDFAALLGTDEISPKRTLDEAAWLALLIESIEGGGDRDARTSARDALAVSQSASAAGPAARSGRDYSPRS